MLDLKDKHVFITGGSAGLGLSIAMEAARRGAHVAIVARREGPLKEAIAAVKCEATDSETQRFVTVAADCADSAAIARALETATAELGGQLPELVVCNAGSSRPRKFVDHSAADFEDMMRVNYLTAAYTAHAAVQHALEHGSERPRTRIVMVSSTGALVGFAGYSAYAPTKAAIIALADCMRHELLGGRTDNMRVHVFLPGSIASPGFDEENKTKPALTKHVERDDPVLEPHAAAAALFRGLDRGHFQITTGHLIPELLRCARAGHAPSNNGFLDFWKYLIAWFALAIWRLTDLDPAARKDPTVPIAAASGAAAAAYGHPNGNTKRVD